MYKIYFLNQIEPFSPDLFNKVGKGGLGTAVSSSLNSIDKALLRNKYFMYNRLKSRVNIQRDNVCSKLHMESSCTGVFSP